MGRPIRRASATAADPHVAYEAFANVERGLLERFPLVLGWPPYDELDDTRVGWRGPDSLESCLEFRRRKVA